jgi:hypothetical protein
MEIRARFNVADGRLCKRNGLFVGIIQVRVRLAANHTAPVTIGGL